MAGDLSGIWMSVEKQAAILGHAMVDRHFYYQCTVWGVRAGRFNLNPFHHVLWSALEAFVTRVSRHPTAQEITILGHDGKDHLERVALTQELEVVRHRASGMPQDVLVHDLRDWSSGEVIKTAVERKLGPAFEAGDVKKLLAAAEAMALELQAISSVGTTANHFESSAVRIVDEERGRQAVTSQILDYGIRFLDEATGGLMPNDLVLLGSKSGTGKTQLATNIATYNAEQGKRVAYFALEAEDLEIERRIKFAEVYRLWFKDPNRINGHRIRYQPWRQGRLLAETSKYDDIASAYVKRTLGALRTYYRTHGDFTVDTLEREIVRAHKDTDLIIIDHVHYIDQREATTQENAEMKAIVKRLRDCSIAYGTPILVIAHLRKSDARAQKLVPEIEDFMGSSDLYKVCTAAVMMGPAFDLVHTSAPGNDEVLPQPRNLVDTYLQVAKSRSGGREFNSCTAVAIYDLDSREYNKAYAYGRLLNMGRDWKPEEPPDWAKSATILNIRATAAQSRGA